MIRRLVLSTMFLLLCFVAAPHFAFAASDTLNQACSLNDSDGKPLTGAALKAKQESTVCKDAKNTADPVSGNDGIIMKAVKIIGWLAGAAAVVIIILGSFRFITSHGDPANVKKAKDSIFYAVIGLVIIVLAEAIIRFVLGKL